MKIWQTTSLVTALLAIGVPGYLPVGSAEEGKNVTKLVTEAKNPADHKAVSAFYRKESRDLQREANQHTELAKKLVSEAGGQLPSASHHYDQAEHCRRFADLLEKAAQEAQSLANFHEGLAQSSEGTGGEKK